MTFVPSYLAFTSRARHHNNLEMKQQLVLLCVFIAVVNCYIMVSVSHVQLTGQDPAEVIANSLDIYESDVAQASALGANIIIFPEFGLGGSFLDRTTMLPFCGLLPPLGTVACGSDDNLTFTVLEQASCMALKNKIIVVINTCQIIPCSSSNDSDCPDDGRYQYNTEIVVDESGALIAVYHKSHPFYINCFNTPHPYDVITFNASFGIEFGVFVCFDIAFDSPSQALFEKGIRHFAYSSSIGNGTATFAFETWSKKYESALHVSNLGHAVGGVYVNGTLLPYTTQVMANGDELLVTQISV